MLQRGNIISLRRHCIHFVSFANQEGRNSHMDSVLPLQINEVLNTFEIIYRHVQKIETWFAQPLNLVWNQTFSWLYKSA